MTMLVEKGNYISRVWVLTKQGATFDVMMVLSRQLPDGEWLLNYRFRYYRDDKTHDSDDVKNNWAWSFPDKSMTEAEAIRKVGPILQNLKNSTRLNCEVIKVETDDPVTVIEILNKNKNFHVKMVGGGSA